MREKREKKMRRKREKFGFEWVEGQRRRNMSDKYEQHTFLSRQWIKNQGFVSKVPKIFFSECKFKRKREREGEKGIAKED